MEPKSPLVSVIIPTYNQAHLLKKALESVQSQSYKNIEIIVIDNNSTDETEEVVAGIKSSQVTYIKNNNNGVIAISRNIGIRNAKGEWLAFLDSDDIWYQKKIEIVIASINKNTKYSVYCTDENIRNEKGIYGVLKYGPYKKNNFYQFLIESGNCISTSASVIKKEFLIKYGINFSEDKKYVTAEDYEFWMQLALHGAEFKFIPSIQGEYFIHSNNMSGNAERHKNAVKAVLLDHVMGLQKFANPKKLWNLVETRILVEEALDEARRKNFKKMLLKIIEAQTNSKLGLIKIIKIKFFNKINDSIPASWKN